MNPKNGFTVRLLATIRLGIEGRIDRRLPFASTRAIRRRQTQHLRRVVRHAFQHVPFYRNAARDQGVSPLEIRTVEDLQRLPLIDGRMLQRDPRRFVSEASAKGALLELHSTGTAAYGRKNVFWTEKALLSQLVYGERDRAVLRALLGKTWGQVRLSFFAPASSTAEVSDFLQSRIVVPRSLLRTHHASSGASLEETIAELNRVRPDVVHSYGSHVDWLYRSLGTADVPFPVPRVWVYGGDAISPEGRDLVRQSGCRVHSTYQAVEAGRIGFFCENGDGFHVNTDICHVRLIDPEGREVEPGAEGEVVISNLYNLGTVLLNYRLGDRAIWAEEACSCGRNLPRLRALTGRTSDLLHLADGREILDHAFLHKCKAQMHEVRLYQIVENGVGDFVWRVIPEPGVDQQDLVSRLSAVAQAALGERDSIRVELVDRMLPSPSGKISRVIRPKTRGETERG